MTAADRRLAAALAQSAGRRQLGQLCGERTLAVVVTLLAGMVAEVDRILSALRQVLPAPG